MATARTPITKSQLLGLVAMALGVLVIANDFTALSVALPHIERDFKSDVTTVQWVINGYALVFGVLIVTGGRLADMFGRRRIFFLGAAIFAVFSLVGGLAPDVWVLLVSRGLMGIGGAILTAAALGFLGLGAQPPAPEWGVMISDGRPFLRQQPHMVFFPGMAIMFSVLGFNRLGDGLRDALDPQMQE